MVEIFTLSPGHLFGGSHARGRAARLYLTWLWHQPVVLRPLDGLCSMLLRPLEWLFPIARIRGRWVILGWPIKPAHLPGRLGLAKSELAGCIVVAAGGPVFRQSPGAAAPLDVPRGLAASESLPVCKPLWRRPRWPRGE